MLQTIRDHTQGWIAGTIISVIILSFALWGIHSYFTGGGSNNTIAQVNGVDITREQLSAAYERLRRQMQAQGNMNKNDALLKQRALEVLIELEVLKQTSIKQNFSVSDQQIDNYLQGMPEFQDNGQFSLGRFQEFLSSSLLSTGEFLDLIRTSLLIEQPRLGIIFASFALPNESTETISLVNQERDISYIELPLQYFLSQPMTITTDEIKTYYQQHQREFMTPEQLSVEYVALNLKDLIGKMSANDDQLKTFYNENINSYSLPMSWKLVTLEIPLSTNATTEQINQTKLKAEMLNKAMIKGDDLAKLAKSFNANLIKYESVTLDQLPNELHQPVSTLNKHQNITSPIRTEKGFVLVKALEFHEAKVQPLEDVKDKVKNAYLRQHAEEKFAELRDKLADLTYEHPDSLQTAASTLNIPIQTSEIFEKEKGGNDISQYKQIRDIAFGNDVLNLQNNSDVIQVNPETVIVLRQKTHTPSSIRPFNKVSTEIQQRLKNLAAERKAMQFAEDLKHQLQATKQLVNIKGQQLNLNWHHAGFIGRYSKKVESAILDAAFGLPNPIMNGKNEFGITKLPHGYAVIAVHAVKHGNITDPKQKAIFEEQVQNSEGLLEYELYKLSAIKHAKIKIEN